MSQILKSVKGSSARYIISDWKERNPLKLKRLEVRDSAGVHYRVWQKGGGFDKNVYSLEAVRKAIDYIEWNPVRAGFVENPTDWKWSSAAGRESADAAIFKVDSVAWSVYR